MVFGYTCNYIVRCSYVFYTLQDAQCSHILILSYVDADARWCSTTAMCWSHESLPTNPLWGTGPKAQTSSQQNKSRGLAGRHPCPLTTGGSWIVCRLQWEDGLDWWVSVGTSPPNMRTFEIMLKPLPKKASPVLGCFGWWSFFFSLSVASASVTALALLWCLLLCLRSVLVPFTSQKFSEVNSRSQWSLKSHQVFI